MTQEYSSQLMRAYQTHQMGEIGKAEQLYLELIGIDPNGFDAFQLLGALMLQAKRPEDAIPHLLRAIELKPDSSSFWANLGIAYSRSGNLDDAIHAYLESLKFSPNNYEVLKNLGTLYVKKAMYAEAYEPLSQAMQIKPQSIELQMKLGLVFLRLKREEESMKLFEKVIESEPNHIQALSGIGQILMADPKPSQRTIDLWRKLVELDPHNPAMHNNLASVLKNSGQHDESERECRKALELLPGFFPALCNLGLVFALEGRFQESRDFLVEALDAAENRLVYESNNDRLRQAYLKIAEATWDEYNCTTNCQLASVTNILGNEAEAHQAVNRALTIDSEHVDSHMMRAFLHLQSCEFEKGWPEYEWRKKGKHLARAFPTPEWRGEEARNQTILIHVEQGLGDTIHFSRYCRLVKERVGRVLLLTHRPLVHLMEMCPDIDVVIADGDRLPPYDLHVALLSLPSVFRSSMESIPRKVPYLFASPKLVEDWHGRLMDFDGLRVGIAWQGNREFANDQFRRVPLKMFEPLAAIPGVSLICLQKGDGLEQLSEIDFEVTMFPEMDTQSGAFMDTAAVMMNLDLIISPCTATPHLAGALGRNVWLAKSFVSEWRWVADDREENPWYPTMRMFRQPTLGDWGSVFERMAKEIKVIAGKRKQSE